MEDMVINIAARPDVLIYALGAAGFTTLTTICSGLSTFMPDVLTKESKFLGIRFGAIRGIYNPFMKVVNKIALNTGKAANNPSVQ